MSASRITRLPRVDFIRQVLIVALDGKQTVERLWAENLSLGGMFVRSSQPLPPGTRVRVALDSLQDTFPLGEAEVIWQKTSATLSTRSGGFGLRFTQLKSAARSFVETLVRHGGTAAAPVALPKGTISATQAAPDEPTTEEHEPS